MKDNRRKEALSGVVVEPDDQDAKWNMTQQLPDDPGWRVVCLDKRHDVSERPDHPHHDAGYYGAPPILQAVNGISLPAHLFTHSADEKRSEKDQRQCDRDMRIIRERRPEYLHQSKCSNHHDWP